MYKYDPVISTPSAQLHTKQVKELCCCLHGLKVCWTWSFCSEDRMNTHNTRGCAW